MRDARAYIISYHIGPLSLVNVQGKCAIPVASYSSIFSFQTGMLRSHYLISGSQSSVLVQLPQNVAHMKAHIHTFSGGSSLAGPLGSHVSLAETRMRFRECLNLKSMQNNSPKPIMTAQKAMQNDSPKPIVIAQQAIILHSFGVQVALYALKGLFRDSSFVICSHL